MIGQSSGRTKCVVPTVYQSTTSLSLERAIGLAPLREPDGLGLTVGIAARRVALGILVAA